MEKEMKDQEEKLLEPLAYSVVIGIITVSGILSNLVSLFYICKKLEVNQYVRRILKTHTSVMLTLQTLSFIGYCLVVFGGFPNAFTCSIYKVPILSGLASSYVFPAAIAVIRYHMAGRVANQRAIQHWYVIAVSRTASLLQCLVCASMFYSIYNPSIPFGPVVESCYRQPDQFNGTLPWPPLLSFFISVCSLTIGIVFDIAMLNFLRKRRQRIQPKVAMISWNNHNVRPPLVSLGPNDKSHNSTIPIQATCLGVVNMCFILVLLYFGTLGLDQKRNRLYYASAAAAVCNVIHMPLVLLLTVKSNNKKSKKRNLLTVPPTGLQFHEES